MTSVAEALLRNKQREREIDLSPTWSRTMHAEMGASAVEVSVRHPQIGPSCAPVCGQPTRSKRSPRTGEGIYCRRIECQRQRSVIKQARYRAGKEHAVTRIEKLDTELRESDVEH